VFLQMIKPVKITALAGGVGGAKLADGLAKVVEAGQLSVIVNTGDDLDFCGLHISPDIDTVCYTLAGLANPLTGWGQVGETWEVFDALGRLGAPNWFHIGDHDLAIHLERTRLINDGVLLTEVTRMICSQLGVKAQVLPMSDQSIRTIVHTRDGRKLGFQEYFVKEQCQPEVTQFEFIGLSSASPSNDVIQAVDEADLIVICPSNPWVSIDPILKLTGIQERLRSKKVVAVSPIIGGKTIKGPAAKMFAELGLIPGSIAVADHYRDFLSGFVLDSVDHKDEQQISAWGIIPLVTNTIMRSMDDRIKLAIETVKFGLSLPSKG
jgi:LPPG:FO 2-phospho-L-lactate transferase